jgi:hypothetical protein
VQTTLPTAIQDKLTHTRGRLRLVDVALGLARAILAVAIVLVVLFSLDTTLKPPLLVVRSFALFMALVATTLALVCLAKPLRRRLGDDDVALMVEAQHPELEGGLISSVQLARELGRDDLYMSRDLIRSTIDRAARDVDQVDFGRVVSFGPMLRLWGLIGAFLLLGGGLLADAQVQRYAGIFVDRVVWGNAEAAYPAAVDLRVHLNGKPWSPDQVFQVAKGDDLGLAVHVLPLGGSERVQVHTRYAGADETESRDLLRYDDHFSKSFTNVTDPFEFVVEDPVHGVQAPRYGTFKIDVVQRPWVEQYEFVLTYPDYTGKAPEAVTQPDLQVPEGTTIHYAAVSNKPLEGEHARLIFEREVAGAKPKRSRQVEEEEAKERPQLLASLAASALGPEGQLAPLSPTVARLELRQGGRQERTLLGSFRVDGDLRFRFRLRSTEGLETGKKPVVFSVRAVPDRRPVVTIPVPGRRRMVTPQAKVPLEIVVKDDYGIADVVLVQQVQRAGETAEEDPQTIQLEGVESGARSLRLAYVFDMADQRLQPGDWLRYRAKAFDHNLDTTKNFKESRRYEIQVVRPEDLERMLQDRLAALKDRLEVAAKDQVSAREGSTAFAQGLGPKGVLNDADKKAIQRLDYDQRRVTTRLQDVEKELLDLQAERELNRLTEEAAVALLKDLTEGVHDLAERASPLISRALEDARSAPTLDDRTKGALRRVPDMQADVLEEIRQLIGRIDKWGDFTEVLQEIRDVQSGQDTIIEGTRRAVQDKHQ